MSEQGGQGGHAPNVRDGGAEYHLSPQQKFRGPIGPLGLVFFSLENVLSMYICIPVV